MLYKKRKQYRLPGYDYTQPGEYFITICTQERVCVLGKIENGTMHLSIIGQKVYQFLHEIPKRFAGIMLDEWVIMPDHIHLILVIHDDNKHTPRHVPTLDQEFAGLQPLLKDSVSSVINHVKGNVKRWCNQNGFQEFAWQARFHDHIIRNQKSLVNIRKYIRNNPLEWSTDENNM